MNLLNWIELSWHAKMNGVCSTGTGTASIDPRGSITSAISPINKRAISGTSGSVNVSGCLPTSQGPDCSMRKSRSQGGKILQKCLSTASYGEEMSLSVSLKNLKATSPCHSFLISRKYCSFGSSNYVSYNIDVSTIFSWLFSSVNLFSLSFSSLNQPDEKLIQSISCSFKLFHSNHTLFIRVSS